MPDLTQRLTTILAPPKPVATVPLVWTKVEVGGTDGATIDVGMLSVPNVTPGLYINSSSFASTTSSGQSASGGAYRFGNANNRAIQLVRDDCVGLRAYGYYPFDGAATLVDVFVDFDGVLANRDDQLTFDAPVSTPTLLFEVTGLARGTHALMLRENGAGVFGVDYFEYQS